jgi:hypothetical protein
LSQNRRLYHYSPDCGRNIGCKKLKKNVVFEDDLIRLKANPSQQFSYPEIMHQSGLNIIEE